MPRPRKEVQETFENMVMRELREIRVLIESNKPSDPLRTSGVQKIVFDMFKPEETLCAYQVHDRLAKKGLQFKRPSVANALVSLCGKNVLERVEAGLYRVKASALVLTQEVA